MITKFLESLEDPNRPLLGPNVWILKKMGLILPHEKSRKFMYISIHAFITGFVFTQFLELFVIKSDLDLVLNNLKLSMLCLIGMVKVNTLVIWQSKWLRLFDYIDAADKFERDNKDSIRARIIESYTKYGRRVLIFYWILVFVTVAAVINTPIIRYSSSSTFREALRNGTEQFPHVFSAWSPIDDNKPPGSWCTVVFHAIMCSYGGGIVSAYDSSIMVIMVFFRGKMELLRERCKQIFGTNDLGVSNEQAGATIAQLHEMHDLLVKNLTLFNSLLSPVMFFYVVICSLVLCFSAFQLTTATDTIQRLLTAEYLIFGVAQLFMYCWHSNDVIVKSGNVMMGPYESEWWTASIQQRKNVLLLAGQLRRVHIFTAGPFTDLTLATFITILKGAYSYFTLLRD